MLWGLFGAVLGVLSVVVLQKLLRRTLEGKSQLGVFLIALSPLTHFALLLVAALTSRSALLWAAGGDCAALFICVTIAFLRGRSKHK